MNDSGDRVCNSVSQCSSGEPWTELEEENYDNDDPIENPLELCVDAANGIDAPDEVWHSRIHFPRIRIIADDEESRQDAFLYS